MSAVPDELVEEIFVAIRPYLHPTADHRAVRAEIAAGYALATPIAAPGAGAVTEASDVIDKIRRQFHKARLTPKLHITLTADEAYRLIYPAAHRPEEAADTTGVNKLGVIINGKYYVPDEAAGQGEARHLTLAEQATFNKAWREASPLNAVATPRPAPVAPITMADWSDLPKDIYVIEAKSHGGIAFDVMCCSVPMMTVPEVRYTRADLLDRPAPVAPDIVEKCVQVAAMLREKDDYEYDQFQINAAYYLDEAAEALAALSSELAEANARAERQWTGWVKEEVARKAADAEVARLKEREKDAVADEREACATLLDVRAQEYNRIRDPGMANHCRALAAAIRARALQPTEKERPDEA